MFVAREESLEIPDGVPEAMVVVKMRTDPASFFGESGD